MRRIGLLLLLPQIARAEGPPPPVRSANTELRVERAPGASGCDDRERLAQRVEAILGRALSPTGRNGGLTLSVHFTREGSALVARVSASGAKPGVRELVDAGPGCQGLSEAVAVALALLLDGAAEEAAEPPPAAPATAPAPAVPSTATPPLASSAAQEPRWHAHASLGAAGSYGLGGGATWLGFGRLGARTRHWVLDLGVAGTAPTREPFDDGSVRTSLWFGAVRGCYLLGASRSLSVGPCAQLGFGQLRGQGENYGQVRRVGLPWSAISLGLGAELPLGARWFLTFEGSLWVPLEKLTFSVQNRGTAWESKPVAAQLGAGLSLRVF